MANLLPDLPTPEPESMTIDSVKSAPVPGTSQPGATGWYRNLHLGSQGAALQTIHSDARYPKTAHDVFEQGLARKPHGHCLGHRPWNAKRGAYANHYEWLTYSQVAEKRTAIGSAICGLVSEWNLPAHTPLMVGLWSNNRPEWQIVNQACNAYSLQSTSLYDTLGPNVVQYIMNHAEVRIVFCSAVHIPALLALAGKCPTLKAIVSMDNFKTLDTPTGGPEVGGLPKLNVLQSWADEKRIHIYDIAQLEEMGKRRPKPHIPPKPEQIASICYTSGTTGDPKGVIFPHHFLATCAVTTVTGLSVLKNPNDEDECFFSFLPLSHIFARFTEDATFLIGVSIAYSTGNTLNLVSDLSIAKPGGMIVVPRVLNRLYAAIAAQTIEAPGLKGIMARKAFAAKLHNLQTTGSVTHPLWDRLIMNKIRALVGGKLRWMSSGSAPLSPVVSQFIQCAFCLPIIEGYGATETGGCTSRMMLSDTRQSGNVGAPFAANEIKLVSVPDMGYRETDKPHPRGEIWVRGIVSPGYFKEPEKTKEAFEDGWFKTGDVGMFDECGRLHIIDRIKNLVKLAQGEYVAVEKVENVYAAVPLALQTYIYADSLENSLLLFVVPEPVAFAALASKVLGRPVAADDAMGLADAATNNAVLSAAFDIFEKEASSRKLVGFEKAKKLAFRTTPFSEAENTMTPTMKYKRNIANKLLKAEADKMYAQLRAASKGAAKL